MGAPAGDASVDDPGAAGAGRAGAGRSVLLLVIGTRGDVNPFLALGEQLGARGYHVRVATHDAFAAVVRRCGFEFVRVRGDPKLWMELVANKSLTNMVSSFHMLSQYRTMMSCIMEDLKAFLLPGGAPVPGTKTDLGPALHRPSLVVANPIAVFGIHVAEALGVPAVMLFTMPWTRSRVFPCPLSMKALGSYEQSALNPATYDVMETGTWLTVRDIVNELREAACLPAVSVLTSTTVASSNVALHGRKVPFLYCWSKEVFPKPEDWGEHVMVGGYLVTRDDRAALLAPFASPPPNSQPAHPLSGAQQLSAPPCSSEQPPPSAQRDGQLEASRVVASVLNSVLDVVLDEASKQPMSRAPAEPELEASRVVASVLNSVLDVVLDEASKQPMSRAPAEPDSMTRTRASVGASSNSISSVSGAVNVAGNTEGRHAAPDTPVALFDNPGELASFLARAREEDPVGPLYVGFGSMSADADAVRKLAQALTRGLHLLACTEEEDGSLGVRGTRFVIVQAVHNHEIFAEELCNPANMCTVLPSRWSSFFSAGEPALDTSPDESPLPGEQQQAPPPSHDSPQEQPSALPTAPQEQLTKHVADTTEVSPSASHSAPPEWSSSTPPRTAHGRSTPSIRDSPARKKESWPHPRPVPATEMDKVLETLKPIDFLGVWSGPNSPSSSKPLASWMRPGRVVIPAAQARAGWEALQTQRLLIREARHSELFAKCSAVVHHGGAGTFMTALHAGVPQLVMPFFGDQYLWADAVCMRGVGSALPQSDLTPQRFAKCVERCLTPNAHVAAAEMGQRLRAELSSQRRCGAAGCADAIEAWLERSDDVFDRDHPPPSVEARSAIPPEPSLVAAATIAHGDGVGTILGPDLVTDPGQRQLVAIEERGFKREGSSAGRACTGDGAGCIVA
jgi:UDP:flavonoid glycosyltransferase YjiC (YdhE family)